MKSELKTYIAPTADGTGLADYYLKSEAGKVIAELEESHKKEVEQLLMEIVRLKGRLSLLAKKFKANSTAQQGKRKNYETICWT